MSSKGIKIQRGYIAGIVAVCVMSISTGLVLRYADISASTFGSSKLSQSSTFTLQRCIKSGLPQTEAVRSDLTSSEISKFGASAKAYNLKINKKKASHRFVIGAKKNASSTDKLASVKTLLSLTLKEGQSFKQWNSNMVVGFTDRTTQTDIKYGTIKAGTPWEGSFDTTFKDTSGVKIFVQFYGKNYDGCVNDISLTELLSGAEEGGGDDIVKAGSLTLQPGFNAVSIPSTEKVYTTKTLKDAGMKVFTYNRHGDEKWYTTGSSTEMLKHRVGYYVYNPGAKRTIKVAIATDQAESEASYYIVDGWNLMANSSGSNMALKDIEFYLNPCPPATTGTLTCKAIGTKVKLSDLFAGDADTQKAYPIIFTIDNPNSPDPDVAFKELTVTDANRETAVIPANTMFWVYVWPS